MSWPPQLENGELLKAAGAAGFDVLLTSDQNIRFQQNLVGQRLALITLGSNIWKIIADYRSEITAAVDKATPGSQYFIRMPLPSKRGTDRI
jgi:hypothetical protein